MFRSLGAATIAVLTLQLVSTAADSAACLPFAVPGVAVGSCFTYPALSSLPAGPFLLVANISREPYLVTSPCANIDAAEARVFHKVPGAVNDWNCSTFVGGDDAGAPAYEGSGLECFALGHLTERTVSSLDPVNASAGVALQYGGGVGIVGCGSRTLRYELVCDPTASPTAGPTAVTEHTPGNCGYTITWPTAAACSVVAAPSASCTNVLPVPTPEQLDYQNMGIGALISFNMATAAHTEGCGLGAPPPRSDWVAPSKADTDQWCKAVASFGGRYATLVAKHECGFTLWPTKASSGGFNYSYGVESGDENDMVRQFVESCAAYGVKVGIYYSINRNSYLNVWDPGAVRPGAQPPLQAVVTQEQYADIVTQQLTELWGNYGELAEIWFDGGYGAGIGLDHIPELAKSLQPHTVTFGGCADSMNSPVNWVGTESGHAPYPLWYTSNVCGVATAGTPFGSMYVPIEVDVTLENSDTWFYDEAAGYKSFPELVGIYHDSVGHGGNLLLNLAPMPNTSIPQIAMDLYANLGDFVRKCYGQGDSAAPSAIASSSGCHNCTSITLALSNTTTGAMFDRVLIKEELRGGQRIVKFELLADGAPIFSGQSVGSTMIALLGKNVTAKALEMRVTAARAPPSIAMVAVPSPISCAVASVAGGCNVLVDTAYAGITISTSTTSSVDACCAACRKLPACAFFTATQSAAWPYPFSCALLSAMQYKTHKVGVTSGSPTGAASIRQPALTATDSAGIVMLT